MFISFVHQFTNWYQSENNFQKKFVKFSSMTGSCQNWYESWANDPYKRAVFGGIHEEDVKNHPCESYFWIRNWPREKKIRECWASSIHYGGPTGQVLGVWDIKECACIYRHEPWARGCPANAAPGLIPRF